MSTSTSKVVTDILTQLSNVLPTGTFLVFQILAPLSTNNGDCGTTEIVLTSFTLTLLCGLCCASCFTDSYKADDGKVYYGFVTPRGLWNPTFRHTMLNGANRGPYYKGAGEEKYRLELDDFVNAGLSVVALATISLLTAPVTTCFYPHIPQSVLKTVPLLTGLVVGAVCAFGTTPRNGVGFAMAPSRDGTQLHQPPRNAGAAIEAPLHQHLSENKVRALDNIMAYHENELYALVLLFVVILNCPAFIILDL